MQVELHKKEQLLERQSERLSASQRVIAEQEEELAEVARELEATEQENSRLRESMEKMLVENDFGRYDENIDVKHFVSRIAYFKYRPKLKYFFWSRLERDSMQLDKDVLLRKLLEAEMDSNAAAKQVSALRETVGHMSRSVSVSKIPISERFWVDFSLQNFETNLKHLVWYHVQYQMCFKNIFSGEKDIRIRLNTLGPTERDLAAETGDF